MRAPLQYVLFLLQWRIFQTRVSVLPHGSIHATALSWKAFLQRPSGEDGKSGSWLYAGALFQNFLNADRMLSEARSFFSFYLWRTQSSKEISMGIYGRLGQMILILSVLVNAGVGFSARRQDSAQQDRAAIERLHQEDVKATLTDKADELAKLWDIEAARIQPGRPAEVGKAVIYANDKRWETSGGR
jgi:hypothetical protein